MSGSSESDSSHRSGGEPDLEGAAASSSESKMPDTRKRRRKPQIIGKAWILLGEITTNPLNNDSGQASMDGDANYDAKVQNTKSQTESALGPKFENLFQKMRLNVRYFVCFGNLVNCCNTSQDSSPGFPPIAKSHGTDGAEKIAVRSRVCVSIRRMGAL